MVLWRGASHGERLNRDDRDEEDARSISTLVPILGGDDDFDVVCVEFFDVYRRPRVRLRLQMLPSRSVRFDPLY